MSTEQHHNLISAATDRDGEPYTTQLTTFISPGLPYYSIIGMPETSLEGTRERVHSALTTQGFAWPDTRTTTNITPASRTKAGRGQDLPIAASVMIANRILDAEPFEHTALIGELADDGDWHSDGTILPVENLPTLLTHLAAQGVRTAIIPEANHDIDTIDGMRIVRISQLSDLLTFGHETQPLIDRIDRLVEDAHNAGDTDESDDHIAELEAALDSLNDAISHDDREPNTLESAAIAQAEQTIDDLQEEHD